MQTGTSDPLFEYALRMGDNCLILSHRVSEWCGHAPALEEDIALANTALDSSARQHAVARPRPRVEGAGRQRRRNLATSV